MSEELVLLFQDIGLSEAKSKETAKNVNLSKNLEALIKYSKGSSLDIKPVGLLLYHIASKIKPQIHHHLNLLADYVRDSWALVSFSDEISLFILLELTSNVFILTVTPLTCS